MLLSHQQANKMCVTEKQVELCSLKSNITEFVALMEQGGHEKIYFNKFFKFKIHSI